MRQAGATRHHSAWASHYRGLSLQSTGSRRAGSVVVAHGPSCSAACGILPDQGLNPCPLHWQADSQPLHHQGSPILCISAGSVVISPFSFLILLICVLSLFFLMSLAKGLSILFIFPKNQLLVLLIFAIVSFISFSFISDLIFMISFLLLTLGLFCSSFSNCFRYKVRLVI